MAKHTQSAPRPITIEADDEGDITIFIPNGAAERSAAPESKSGKSRILASTSGFTKIATRTGEVSIGLNALIK